MKNDEEKNWRYNAACGNLPDDTEIDFYAADGPGIKAAKKVCSDCPVRLQCITEAMKQEERWGVWGGVDEQELRRALSINEFGIATIKAKAPRCPYCTCEELDIVEKRRTRTHVKCVQCGFAWWTRRSMPKRSMEKVRP